MGFCPPHAEVFENTAHGTCTDEERFSLALLMLIRKIKAPHYAYNQIIELVKTLVLNKVKTLTGWYRKRNTALAQFARRFQLEPLLPVLRHVEYKSKKCEVVLYNANAINMSLLKSDLLLEDNLLLPNPGDLLGDLPLNVGAVADIDIGEAFHRGFCKIRNAHPTSIPVGIILYMDKLALDRHGHLLLEPVYFTLTLFNYKTRNQPNSWCPMGYIQNLQLQSPAKMAKSTKGTDKVQLYHKF
jgi:hypothetical protein